MYKFKASWNKEINLNLCEGCKYLIKLKIGNYHHIKYCKFEKDNNNFFISLDKFLRRLNNAEYLGTLSLLKKPPQIL